MFCLICLFWIEKSMADYPPDRKVMMPIIVTTVPINLARVSFSPKNTTPMPKAIKIELSRIAITTGIGAWVKAHITKL